MALSDLEAFEGKKECKRCGYTWHPRTRTPKCCPECKSRSWDKEKANE